MAPNKMVMSSVQSLETVGCCEHTGVPPMVSPVDVVRLTFSLFLIPSPSWLEL